jgi:hypothetical protein
MDLEIPVDSSLEKKSFGGYEKGTTSVARGSILVQFCRLANTTVNFPRPALFVLELSMRAQKLEKLLLLAINKFSDPFQIPRRQTMENYLQKRGKMKIFHVFEALHEFLQKFKKKFHVYVHQKILGNTSSVRFE